MDLIVTLHLREDYPEKFLWNKMEELEEAVADWAVIPGGFRTRPCTKKARADHDYWAWEAWSGEAEGS